MSQAAYVYSEAMSRHVLRADHPMRPMRLQYTYELLKAYGAFQPEGTLVDPRMATEEELRTFHTEDYIRAVQQLSNGSSVTLFPRREGARISSARYGFSDAGDNPVYPGMYEAALLAAGGSVVAAELIANKQVQIAFNPAGGLHHAMADRASGFCIFNDPVIAINKLRERGLRVLYLDIDAHHGDGVQEAYYADPWVMTISLHESGKYLFPGSGNAMEVGAGEGRGFCVNLPLLPYTDDDVYLEAFNVVVPALVRAFHPDVLATQLGIDTYVTDPLAHLSLTSRGYVQVLETIKSWGYPWLAFGGGGYDLDAVARCWALAYGVMTGREWPDIIPAECRSFVKAERLRDASSRPANPAVQQQARRFAQEGIEVIRRLVFPIHGL